MYNKPRLSSLVLSRGAVLDTKYPALGDPFPDGSTTHIDFFDSNGVVITTITGTVEPKWMKYLVVGDGIGELDKVPNGSQYELWVTTGDGPYKYEYGTIIRREATFYDTLLPTSDVEGARLFSDPMSRSAVGRKWVVTRGGIAMHNVSSASAPRYVLGPDTGLLFSQAGVRYYRPMGGDSWRFQFGIYSIGSFIGIGGTGKMRLICGCDSSLTVGMGFEIETGLSNNYVHTGLVTAPTDMDYTGAAVAETSTDGDVWTVDYSDITKTLQAWKGYRPVDAPPVIEWVDEANQLPHGEGFRYWGFSWDSSLLATGALVSTVEAQDHV